MADELAKALFGSGSVSAGVTVMYGVALEDSEDGEVLVQLDDEIVATGEYDDGEGVEVDLEADDDSLDAIEEDFEEEEPGEDDEAEEEADEVDEDDSSEDSTEETDDEEGV